MISAIAGRFNNIMQWYNYIRVDDVNWSTIGLVFGFFYHNGFSFLILSWSVHKVLSWTECDIGTVGTRIVREVEVDRFQCYRLGKISIVAVRNKILKKRTWCGEICFDLNHHERRMQAMSVGNLFYSHVANENVF